jgi:uncharacterized protein YhbP (UPF0306 family)
MGKSKMDNPEKLATQATQDEEKQYINTTQYVFDTSTIYIVSNNHVSVEILTTAWMIP